MMGQWKKLSNHRRRLLLGGAGALVACASVGAWRLARGSPAVPTAVVTRGEFADYVRLRGEVKALRSVSLMAPRLGGGTGVTQILKLVRTGTAVKKGDPVVEFDTAKIRETLAQKRSELKQAEAEIERARAQARLQEEQDLTDLAKARYDVERARLEASKQEILSKIEGEKNKLALANAEQHLREVEQRLASNRAKAKAEVAGLQQKRDKALFDVQMAEQDIAASIVRAPVDGMVTILRNTWGYPADAAPPFREGDRANPGANVAELPDSSTLRVNGRVEEADRGRLAVGQAATARIDAVPGREFSARVTEISPLAKIDFSAWPFPRNFDVFVELDQADPRVRPGMSATARIAVERFPDSILVPSEATFQKLGRTVAYVLRGSKFEERAVEVARRGEGQVVVARGLRPGERVALKDPTAEK